MIQGSGNWLNRGQVALGIALLALMGTGGVARAESSPAATWAFDLLARVEQWQPATPLDFLPDVAKAQPLSTAAQARLQADYGRLPMHFEPNLGQTADDVQFVARGPGYTLFLTADEAVLALRPSRPASDRTDPRHRRQPFDLAALTQDDTPTVPGAVIRTRLEGTTRNPTPQPEGVDKQPGISNYFLGNDPAKWRTNVPHYARVRYSDVYPGIDLVYYGNPQRLEHDFIVAPGADPAVIQLAISGAEQATVNAEGDLVLTVPGGEVVQQAPKIYQVIDGQQQAVTGRYVLRDALPGASPSVNVATVELMPPPLWVGFEVAQYDRNQPLVIDPVLVYSTYLGGSDEEAGRGIAVDGSGNAYVTGFTSSADFPTMNALDSSLGGLGDVFIVKLSGDGQTLLYSTYLGGSDSNYGGEHGYGIAVDGSGNAYVTGSTISTDFPMMNALDSNLGGSVDAFIVKLSSDGQTLLYSTYLGGINSDLGYGIAVDGSGNAYVTGQTSSTDFPTMNALDSNLGGSGDAFIVKLSGDGQTLLYSTYLGGSDDEDGASIAVDGSGNAYVTGTTYSTDFPTVNARYPNLSGSWYGDAFVFKLNANGSAAIYSTYLGGSDQDNGRGIAVDGSGSAYVTGQTRSRDFPTVNAINPNLDGPGQEVDAFVFVLSGDGQTVRYSTYLGEGTGWSTGKGIAVDGSGNAYVVGYDYSITFSEYPIDTFIVKLSGDGQTVLYSTHLVGSDIDGGYGIAVDGSGNAYVTGDTLSIDFPIANALQPNLGGVSDAFIAKIAESAPGDVNGDGSVNALDVVAVINAVLGIQSLPAADVNGDGAVNALDVVFVINQVLGIPLA